MRRTGFSLAKLKLRAVLEEAEINSFAAVANNIKGIIEGTVALNSKLDRSGCMYGKMFS